MASPKVALYSAMVFSCRDTSKPTIVGSFIDFSDFSWYQKTGVQEFLTFASRECTARTPVGSKQSVSYQEHVCHVGVLDASLGPLGFAVITSEQYVYRVAHGLIAELATRILQLDLPAIQAQLARTAAGADTDVPAVSALCQELIKKYQNPAEADRILRMQADLADTKDILVQSLDKLLDRGSKLNDLAAKSDDLSLQSKIFLDQSAGLNSCCQIL